MTSISVAIRIWAKAVFLFAVCIGFSAVAEGDFFDMLLAGLFFIVGFIITAPLLLPIFSLVDLSKRLVQYNIPARLAWLVFYLVLMLVVLLVLLSLMAGHRLMSLDGFLCQGVFITTGIMLIAVVTTRKSLNKLYTQSQQ